MSTISSSSIKDTLFGAPGTRDPQYFQCGVGISRVVNLALANATSSNYYKLLALPKRFVMTGVFIEELETCSKTSSNSAALYWGSDTDNKVAELTVGESTLGVGYSSVATSVSSSGITTTVGKFFASGDVLKLKMAEDTTKGKIRVTVFGFTPDNEAIEGYTADMDVPEWRQGQTEAQAAANVGGGDPYTANAAGAGIYPVRQDA